MKNKMIKKLLTVAVVLLGVCILMSFKSDKIGTPIYIVDNKVDATVNIIMEEAAEQGTQGLIEFELKCEEDLKELARLCEQKKQNIQIRVRDYLPLEYSQNPIKALDVIDKFYYDIPTKYPYVKEVVVMGNLVGSDPKVKDKYNKLSIKPYLQVTYGEATEQEQYTFVIPLAEKKGQYIEYKINEKQVGQTSRYPYVFTPNQEDLHKGINQVRVVIHNQVDKKPRIETFYIKYTGEKQYEERAKRSGEIYGKDKKMTYVSKYIPVLMYHKFLKEVGPEEQSIAVATDLFEKHIQRLKKEGYTPINFKQLQDYFKGVAGLPNKPIIITADDGYLCNYEEAYPILKKYQVPATFFVATEYMGVQSFNSHFTWDEAKEMEASGLVDIQSHSHRHKPMNKLTELEVEYEMNTSFALIEKYLGKRDVKVLAYPQFEHTNRGQQWVKISGVDLQITDLVKRPVETVPMEIKRIHVSNETTTDDLMRKIEKVTQKK
ncbi:MAG: polysaccharide deacetylase family protein [Cellulosilyticaceae bacterium]